MKYKAIQFMSIGLLTLLSFTSTYANIEDNSIEQELNKGNTQELDFDFSLQTFSSCKNMEDVMGEYIEDYWEENWKNRPVYNYRYFGGDVLMGAEVISDSVESNIVSSKSSGEGSDDFSKTNTQVEGVDESDIIKTDGKYVYYYNSKDNYVYIIDAQNSDELDIIKKIKIPNNFYSPVLYIDNNRLVIVSSGYSQNNYNKNYWYDRNSKTYTIVFDTTDIKNTKLIKMYVSEGNFTKSRKIGDYIYVLSNNSFNIPYYSFADIGDIQLQAEDMIPKSIELTKTDDISKQNLKLKDKEYPYQVTAGNSLDCNEITYTLPEKETLKKFDFSPSYNVISAININDIEESVSTNIVAGSNTEIFMSTDNLYLTSYMYQNNSFRCGRGMFCSMPFYRGGENTLIHKINVDKNNLTYQDSTIIPGQPLTQYSMDQHDGNFRIITQKYYPERETGVYILDPDLDLLGSLGGLGKTEDFKSSRFMGDKLYLVTFKQIDPFYVIDLEDDINPKVVGELKIPGYSTYLHPYDENHIIGLGYNTSENSRGGTFNDGLKIDLYEIDYDREPLKLEDNDAYKKCKQEILDNISPADAPFIDPDFSKCEDLEIVGQQNLGDIYVAQKFTKTLGENGTYSEALNNPRMFMWNADKNTLLLPAQVYLNEPNNQYQRIDFYQGLFAYEIDSDTGISEKYRLTHIDMGDIETERKEECDRYSQKNNEQKCKLLLDGTEYCSSKSGNSYVPEYCFADSPLGVYKARKSYNYRDQYVQRALWIGDKSFAISNSKISVSDLETGELKETIDLK